MAKRELVGYAVCCGLDWLHEDDYPEPGSISWWGRYSRFVGTKSQAEAHVAANPGSEIVRIVRKPTIGFLELEAMLDAIREHDKKEKR